MIEPHSIRALEEQLADLERCADGDSRPPITLLNDLAYNLFNPDLFFKAFVTTGMLTAVFMVAYLILFLLPRISLEPVTK